MVRAAAAVRTQLADAFEKEATQLKEVVMKIASLDNARHAMKNNSILTGVVTGRAAGDRWGGFSVDIGIPAVMRARDADAAAVPGDEREWLIGQTVEVKVVEIEDEGLVFVSRRAVLETDRLRDLRKALLESLPHNQPRVARVALVLPFGAFVDLDGVAGFLPVADLGQQSIVAGQGLSVEVVGIDVENMRANVKLGPPSAPPPAGGGRTI